MLTIFEEINGDLIAVNSEYIRYIKSGEHNDCFLYMAHTPPGEKDTFRIKGALPEVISRILTLKKK